MNIRSGATLAAGGGPGTTFVNGAVDFKAGSILGIQLNGLTDTDADRSRISSTGALAFAGAALLPFSVDVSNAGSFPGGAPATFTIASALSINSIGLLSPVTLTVGPGGSGFATNSSNIRLVVSGFQPLEKFTLQKLGAILVLSFAPAFAADFDEDGDVDVADLVEWRTGFGINGAAIHMDGDADGDSDVDGADFFTWQRQLGSAATVAASSAVPDPASLRLLIFCALAMFFRRRAAVS